MACDEDSDRRDIAGAVPHWTVEEQAIVMHNEPMVAAELRRIGVSEEDQLWIHAGSDKRPTATLYQEWLGQLRALPSNLGVESYCAWLGFDYESMKRELSRPVHDGE